MSTPFQRVAAMNIAFGNPVGDPANIDWGRVRKQCLNIPDELGELLIALGAAPAGVRKSIAILKANTVFEKAPDVEEVRDALCDVNVFAGGGQHMIGVDGDADMNAVLDGIMTRFCRDAVELQATLDHWSANGVSQTYIEGEFPKMVVKSAEDQLDAPKGKFLKSVGYRKPVFAQLTVAENKAA